MKLVGRTVLITGASSGIGEAVARTAYERGATLLLVARGDAKLKELPPNWGSARTSTPATSAIRPR